MPGPLHRPQPPSLHDGGLLEKWQKSKQNVSSLFRRILRPTHTSPMNSLHSLRIPSPPRHLPPPSPPRPQPRRPPTPSLASSNIAGLHTLKLPRILSISGCIAATAATLSGRATPGTFLEVPRDSERGNYPGRGNPSARAPPHRPPRASRHSMI